MDERVPLYERIKFLAIYSSNLDEFFRVRVASLRSFKELKKKDREAWFDIKPKKELKAIRTLVNRQQELFGRVFRESIIPALQKEGIFLVDNERCSATQRDFALTYFADTVRPHLAIKRFAAGEAPPFLDNKQLYFIAPAQKQGQAWFYLINIPSDVTPRFVELPSQEQDAHYLIYLDDIIRLALPELIGGSETKAYSVKVSRDAELYIDNEYSGDLVEKIRHSLSDRHIGLPTRFLYDQRMPKKVLNEIRQAYLLSKYDLIPGGRYHNFNDFFAFPNPTTSSQLHDEEWQPLAHPALHHEANILDRIEQGDLLLHFPYQQYDYVPRMIEEAVVLEKVHTIRITLYRLASKSAVIKALLLARQKGKRVEVFVEAKARFDEASNLFWGEELEQAGAQVRYSYPGIKVHTKLLLIERHGAPDFAYLGTGNFNEKTARLYADHALLTTDSRLTGDARLVFELLAGRLIVPPCSHLLVAPFQLRDQLITLIDQEIEQAKSGKGGFLFLKMNSLEEQGMVEKLYEASQAGVQVRLIIRGICTLVPGVAGISENIEVISILDRFLEHARVFVFGRGEQERTYIASADWMSRNLFRRVEVAIPIYDETLQEELKTILELQWRDNTKARIINQDQDNAYRTRVSGEPQYRAQKDIYHYLRAQFDQ